MMNILVSDFVTGLLMFLRIASMFFIAPIFNNQAVPKYLRILLAIAITYIVFFTVPKLDFDFQTGLLILFFMGIKEVLTGMIMGFMLNFVFYALSLAGYLLSREIGLMMATMFDSNAQNQDNIMGVLFIFMGIIIFFIIGGHEYVIKSVSYSFQFIPLGKLTFNESVMQLFIKYSAEIFVLAVKIASPLIVALFFVHVASGIISRISPSFQVFFVLLPLKLGLGIFLMLLMIPIFAFTIRDLLAGYEDKLYHLLSIMAQ